MTTTPRSPFRRAGWVSLLLSFALLQSLVASRARAQVVPYDPDGGVQGDPGGVACGLVETTPDDPDWIMVTSDHILRSSDCVAECAQGCENCWYNRPFDPCYGTNRYWKFEENSGTAFAFTMAALGVGSYDGMYLRRNVKFQLYSSADESAPFGPERRGPIYLSIDFWRDVNVACEGFDPNTVFVSGGPGALANYSIKIGGDTSIEDVDLKKDDNKSEHHTEKYTDDFALRRGAFFEVELKLAEEYGPGCHEVYFEMTHEFDGSETTIEIPPVDGPPAAGEWGTEWIEAETNGDETKKVTVHVHIPNNAAVGRYTLTKALVRNKGTVDPTDEHVLDEPVFVLFNPWSSEDAVYLADDAERTENVLNENGQIWRGSASSNSPKAWRYDQFNTKTVDVAMKLMDGLTAAQRSNPGTVARHFSKLTNSNDDNGVLVGRWDGNYGDGTSPGTWSGSDQIIAEYQGSSTPVKYGQCWVFGGLLTSFLRSVGIPARPLSNFESAHDTDHPANKAVDRYFDTAGRLDRARTRDSIWNFHVWCDAWIGGWNAVDATPQELSGGAYQLGPAPLSAVKAGTGGAFDVDFVTSEVDADIKNWLKQADGTDALNSTDTTHVGRNITTKAVGGSGAKDITSDYKTPESGAPDPRGDTPEDVVIEPFFPETLAFGSDIVWSVRLVNNGTEPRRGNAVIEGSAVGYNGDFIGALDSLNTEFVLDPGATRDLTLTIPVATYLAWTAKTRTFEAAVSVRFPEVRRTHLNVHRTTLVADGPSLSLVEENGATSLMIEWTNPLLLALNHVKVIVATGEGLTFEGQTLTEHPIGLLGGGGQIQLTGLLQPLKPGIHLVAVNIQADELDDVSASVEYEAVADCNANGVPDSEEIASGSVEDCNHNGVPDECDTDCNQNGIPDDCEIAANPGIDCNGNRIPDSCDIASGASQDRNGNGVPDECDPDCNDNDIPDDIDIRDGTSSDFNQNGVPDECDEDCNENGIPDEIDISVGDSIDANLNGVPDECEETQPNQPPVAVCRDVTVTADATGTAAANIDGGSSDPENDSIVVEQQPPGPYPVGATTVKLIVTDSHGSKAECTATVTVNPASEVRSTGPGQSSFDPRRTRP